MSTAVPVTTTQDQPREAIVEILQNSRQFNSLFVESGETEVIPENEVWYIEDSVTVNGTLTVKGDLITVPLWTYGEPDVAKWEDVTMKGKENARSTYLYVHKPESDGINRFSASGDLLHETDTIRVSVWYPANVEDDPSSDRRARAYRNDLIELFRQYINDNFTDSTFHNLEPVDATDFRHQNQSRQSDHHIYSVALEVERLT